MRFDLYSAEKLPPGFRYPVALTELAASGAPLQIDPWWFVDASSPAGKLFFELRESLHQNVIPFAKVDDGRNDIACFDGADRSGDPKVVMLVLDDSGRTYSFPSFAAWLAEAERDSARAWSQ